MPVTRIRYNPEKDCYEYFSVGLLCWVVASSEELSKGILNHDVYFQVNYKDTWCEMNQDILLGR